MVSARDPVRIISQQARLPGLSAVEFPITYARNNCYVKPDYVNFFRRKQKLTPSGRLLSFGLMWGRREAGAAHQFRQDRGDLYA